MFGILLIPLVIVLKYKPVPPTTIGTLFFLRQASIIILVCFNQSPAEKYFFTETEPYKWCLIFLTSVEFGLEERTLNSL